MLWIVLAACLTPAEREAEAYRLALAGEHAAVSACAKIEDPASAGDCLVVLAETTNDADRINAICAAVEDPKWKGECHFVRAERYLRAGNLDAAIAACRASEPFVKDCARHLWQHVTRENMASLQEITTRLMQEFPEWAAVLEPNQDQMQIQQEKEQLRLVEHLGLSLCEGRPAACADAMRRMVGARWRREAQGSEEVMRVLCDSPRVIPDTALFKKLTYEPDPSLDATVEEVKAELCRP